MENHKVQLQQERDGYNVMVSSDSRNHHWNIVYCGPRSKARIIRDAFVKIGYEKYVKIRQTIMKVKDGQLE